MATASATMDVPHGPLMIHEVIAENLTSHQVGGFHPDIIELHNSGGAAVDLGGMGLTDNTASGIRYLFPAGSTIPAGGFMVLYADGGTGANHLPFSINRTGETLTLMDSAANGGGILDAISFGLQLSDFSIGRTGPGLSTWTLCTPTVGTANAAAAVTGAPAALRINEWLGNADYQLEEDFVELFNPAAGPVALGGMALTDDFINEPVKFIFPGGGNYEFIELQNSGSTSLQLEGVRFTRGIDFVFPALTLAPGAYVVVVKSRLSFEERYGPGLPVAGVFAGSLDNSGESLSLRLPAPYELHIHRFDYKDGWEPATDGAGNSLQIVNARAYAGDWDERFSWQAGTPSPGGPTPFSVQAGLDSVAVMPGVAVLGGSLFPGISLPSAIPLSWTKISGPGSVAFNAPASVDTNASFTAPGTYVLRLTATGPGAVTAMDDVRVFVVSDYHTWISSRYPANTSPEVTGKEADPDHDNIPNLIEFALNLDPAANSQHLLPHPFLEGGFLSISYQRINAPGISYVVEFGSGMEIWNQTGIVEVKTATLGNVETWQARTPLAVDGHRHQFIRVRVVSDE